MLGIMAEIEALTGQKDWWANEAEYVLKTGAYRRLSAPSKPLLSRSYSEAEALSDKPIEALTDGDREDLKALRSFQAQRSKIVGENKSRLGTLWTMWQQVKAEHPDLAKRLHAYIEREFGHVVADMPDAIERKKKADDAATKATLERVSVPGAWPENDNVWEDRRYGS